MEKSKHDLLRPSFQKVQEALQDNCTIANLASDKDMNLRTIAYKHGVYPTSEGTTPWMHFRLEAGTVTKTFSVYHKEGVGPTGRYWEQ